MRMTKETYLKLMDWIRSTPPGEKWLLRCSKFLTYFYIAAYCCGALLLCIRQREALLRYLLVPAVVFAFVTLFRAAVNRPRPYDALGYEPIGKAKHGKGKSFPSRHTASAFIIALAACYAFGGIFGGIMAAAACCIGISRVCTGVHYPSDVLCGAGIALLLGIPGFWII